MAVPCSLFTLLLLLLMSLQVANTTTGGTKNVTDAHEENTSPVSQAPKSSLTTTTNNVTEKTGTENTTGNTLPDTGSSTTPTSIFSTLHSGYTNSSTTSNPANSTHHEEGPQPSNGLSDSPGLVAVICIFVSILCIAVVVMAVKFCQKREPAFEKLNDVPMNGLNEEAPFARYPPK